MTKHPMETAYYLQWKITEKRLIILRIALEKVRNFSRGIEERRRLYALADAAIAAADAVPSSIHDREPEVVIRDLDGEAAADADELP